MNIPFSLGDVLERIIPGAIVLVSIILLIDKSEFAKLDPIIEIEKSKFLVSSIFLALSYSLGVVFNVMADFIKHADKRYIPLNEDNEEESYGLKLLAIKAAVEDTFKLEWSDASWRLCYGIAHKTEYSPNIELFAKLNIFCRSMMVSMAFITAALIIKMIHEGSVAPYCSFTILTSLFSFSFFKGAQLYSKSFSSAIYESFFSWYTHEKD